MFVAGTDTTSITSEWGLILSAKQIDVQQKVREELFEALKSINITDYTDPSNLIFDINLSLKIPSFRALMHEIVRISCIARTGVAHWTVKSMQVEFKDGTKYNVPEKSMIV